MGVSDFINRIKGMFAKEPEISEEVSFGNIDEWFSQKYSSKEDFLKGQVEATKEKINGEISSAKQNMENLRNAKLRNENIPEKAKHFMEGNREFYIKQAISFLESLDLPADAKTAASFIAGFDSRLEEFGKSTARSYAILREFVEEEASRIAGSIKNIDKHAGEIKNSLKDSKLKEMDSARQEIAKLKSRIAHREFLIREADKKEGLARSLSADKQRLFREIHEMENSSEYKDLQMLNHKIKKAEKESAEKESEITHLFASLERPMKKYQRIVFSDKDLLGKYISSPVEALTQDFGFKIVGILENMKKAILDNTIELKDKQKIRASEDIRELGKEYLSRFAAQYAQLKKKEKDIILEMRKIKIDKQIGKAKEELKVKTAMLDKAEKDTQSLNSEIGKIDIAAMKKELSEKISAAAGIKMVIS